MNAASAWRRPAASALARHLALAYGLLIIAACLYPFSGWRETGLPWFDFLFAPWPAYWTGADLALNVIGFLPLGFLLAAGLPGPMLGRLLLIIVLGAIFSLSLETLQNLLPRRVASNVDLLCNTLGCLLGALLAIWLAPRCFGPQGAFERWCQARLRPGGGVHFGLALLGVWLLTQFSADGPHFVAADLQAWWPWPRAWSFEAQRFIRLEAVVTALGVVAIGLFVRVLTRAPAWGLTVALMLAGLLLRTLAGVLYFELPRPLVWLTPGAGVGLAIGLAVLFIVQYLAQPLRIVLCALTLIAATILLGMMPDNPYLLGQRAELSRVVSLINLDGLIGLLAGLWPLLALICLLQPALWRRL